MRDSRTARRGGHRRRTVLLLALAALLPCAAALPAQENGEFSLYPVFIAPGAPRYTVTTRFNLARYDGGGYRGHLFRERRASLRDRSDGALPALYRGELYQYEQTLRDQRSVAKRVDRSIPVEVRLHGDGFYTAPEGQALPRRRGFPVIPREPLEPGASWEAPGWMLVDPLWSGTYTRVDFYAGYRYDGVTEYYGTRVHSIRAQYALRYRQGDDPDGDPTLRSISGSHRASILIAVDSGSVVLIRDRIDETYSFTDRESLRLEGFALTFVDSPVPLDRARIAERLSRDLAEERVPDVEIERVEEGVRLRLQNINFEADRAVILPEDYARLDAVTAALNEVSRDRTILVVGHTADVGMPEGQQRLSEERARAVVDELVNRGMAPDRFIYEGRGAREPIGDNDTAEGRARNRRVEITILD